MTYEEILAEPGSTVLMLGNAAIARACLEYGIGLASGYPGTPSSEIIEALAYASRKLGYPYVEWSINEKVAFENAYGAAISGVPSIVAMKHVGLNVAADPLFSSAYTGVESSLLIVSADDPAMWSSQNEQDNRWYGLHAYIPVFEPTGAQDARSVTLEALKFSSDYKHPVILRSVTRVSHTRTNITVGQLAKPKLYGEFKRDTSRWVLVPSNARRLREELIAKWDKITKDLSDNPLNTSEGPRDSRILVIGVGVGYRYSREALQRLKLLDTVRLLKITTSIPPPKSLIVRELEGKNIAIIVEEGDPVFEDQVKIIAYDERLDTKIYGKKTGYIPITGELKLEDITKALADILGLNYRVKSSVRVNIEIPPRPPVLCPGCPYRSVFYAIRRVIKKLKVNVVYAGDIGCYSLVVNPPFNAQDTLVEMGGSIGLANGLSHTLRDSIVIATIGDSTFYHAGIPGTINAVYNRAPMTILVLDNGATAMTGHQPHPGTGLDALGREARRIKIEDIAKASGVDSVLIAKSFNIRDVESKAELAIREALNGKVSMLIARGSCILTAIAKSRRYKVKRPVYSIDLDKCRACTICYNAFACPAIIPRGDGKASIDPRICTGCSACVDVCPFEAIQSIEVVDETWRSILDEVGLDSE
ncbi:MAG: indolepyruvate ferredoxin oxidoreductase subunit alpha [Acidilobaceae archaeon]